MQQYEWKKDIARENYLKNKRNVLMEETTEKLSRKHAKAILSDSDQKSKHKRSIPEKHTEKANKQRNKNFKNKQKHSKDELKYVCTKQQKWKGQMT